MKRSEAIEIIESVLHDLRFFETSKFNEASELILNKLESKGMLKCQMKELGELGKMWTPEGWEEENES